ncbi:MAG: cyclase family protein, partial [Negativicutes bacterium]|nr:cyclase family protein [Negativicutes bacterium]
MRKTGGPAPGGDFAAGPWQDISYPISADLAVYPGDTPFSARQKQVSGSWYTAVLSRVTMGVHIGTHTDAPRHFLPDGASVDELPPDHYIGLCQIVRVDGGRRPDRLITAGDLPEIVAPRLLVDTVSFDFRRPFSERFAVLSADAADKILA